MAIRFIESHIGILAESRMPSDVRFLVDVHNLEVWIAKVNNSSKDGL